MSAPIGHSLEWEEIACGNLDSCEEAQTHRYPTVGSRVTVWLTFPARVVGTDTYVHMRTGEGGVVLDQNPESHEVIVQAKGRRVWLDLDDIARDSQ